MLKILDEFSDSPINYFNDNPYTVYTREVGLVSSFDNQLDIVFRTYENGIFIFSMHDEGDLLVVQIVDGTIYVIYDFGKFYKYLIFFFTANFVLSFWTL